MSKQRTESSKYRSPSTGDYCTGAQYLAEIVCQRNADKEKAGTLPYKFWNLPKWKKLYVRQVGLANKLVKKHGDDFISFIKSKKGSTIISLGMRGIEDAYARYASYKPKRNTESIKIDPKAEFVSRKPFQSNSLSARLNNIKDG